MGLFRRKDPIASRARALKARLADLESQIEQLDQAAPAPPKTPPAVHELKPGEEPLPPHDPPDIRPQVPIQTEE